MKSKQIIRFLIGRFIAALGDQFLMFLAPLIVYHSTGSIAYAGLAYFIEWTPRLLSLPIAGYFADRINSRILYIIADFGRAFICLLSFLLLKYKVVEPFLVITMMMGLLAIFNSLAFITIETSLPRLLSLKDLPKAQSLLQGIDQLSQVGGPALAALLVTFSSHFNLIGLASIGFFISAMNVFWIGPIVTEMKAKSSSTLNNFISNMTFGFKIFRSQDELMILSLLACVVNLVMGTTLAQIAPLVTGFFGRSDQFFGAMTTMAAVLSIMTFTQVPYILKRVSIKKLGLYALALLVLSGILLSQATHIGLFVAGYGLLIASCALFNIFMRTRRSQIIPKDHLGKVIGILVLINNFTLPLSGLFIATFSSKITSQVLILVHTIILLLISVIVNLKLKEVKT